MAGNDSCYLQLRATCQAACYTLWVLALNIKRRCKQQRICDSIICSHTYHNCIEVLNSLGDSITPFICIFLPFQMNVPSNVLFKLKKEKSINLIFRIFPPIRSPFNRYSIILHYYKLIKNSTIRFVLELNL